MNGHIDLIEHLLRNSDARMPKVRITYRLKGQQQTTSRELKHRHYVEWVRDMDANGYELMQAEQVLEG